MVREIGLVQKVYHNPKSRDSIAGARSKTNSTVQVLFY